MAKYIACVALAALVVVGGCGPKGATIAEKQANVKAMAQQTLERLYKEEPASREVVEKKAAGHGVFSTADVNLIFIDMGGGYGIVHDKQSGKDTYMKMALGGLGLGLGVKDYRVVVAFLDAKIMQEFIDGGWKFGGKADAAAKAGDKGGEGSAEGYLGAAIHVWSMTETGLAIQATGNVTKYWKSDELNQ